MGVAINAMAGKIHILSTTKARSAPDYSSIRHLLIEGKLEEYVLAKEIIKQEWKEKRYRICQLCGKEKLIVEFKGSSKYCNTCKRTYSATKKKRTSESQKIWRQTRGLEQVCSTQIVRMLKKMGILVPQRCECCGAEETQAHHDDYNFPWKVRWLCAKCHNEWHKNNTPKRVKNENQE